MLRLKVKLFISEAKISPQFVLIFQAFGCVEAATDRICIQSQGQKNFHISAEDLTSCCHTCGNGLVVTDFIFIVDHPRQNLGSHNLSTVFSAMDL